MDTESPRAMILHSIIIGILLYILMIYLLKQSALKAETRSVLLAALALVYMIKR